MRPNWVILTGTAWAWLTVGAAWCQEPGASGLQQPAAVTDVAMESPAAAGAPQGGASAPSPSNVPAPQPDPATAESAPSVPCPCCDPPAPKPWHLPQPCCMQNLGINMGGWVEQGLTFNSRHPADGFNGPQFTNDLDRQYQLNQLWLYWVRPTKTDGCGWDLGGRIDMCYGTDWRFGQCFGLENEFDSPNSFYGLVLPQFYAEVAVNDLTVKMGHFATLTSYEVVPAPLNFFYSHCYLMSGYFDPLLVTGVQADYKLNDNWTASAGFNRGWQQFEGQDDNENLSFLGGAKWASDNKKASLSVMVESGKEFGFNGQINQRNDVISYFTWQLTEKLKYATQFTVGDENNGSTVEPGANAWWYGIDEYLFYQINAKWSAGIRFEWVRDEGGARIAGIGNVLGTDKGWNGGPGFTGSFTDLTLGLNYRPHPNFLLRPEVRWDWYGGAASNVAFPGSTVPLPQLPFDNHTSRSQFTASMDLVVTY